MMLIRISAAALRVTTLPSNVIQRWSSGRWSSGDPLGPADIDPDDIRDTACDVTAPDQICRPPTPSDADPPDLSDGPDVGGGAGFFGTLLVIVLIAALVLGIAWLVSKWMSGQRVDIDDVDDDMSDLDDSIDEVVDARVIDHETPPDRWRRRAVAARDENDFRESVRCEYRALVGDLARAGHVDEIPGRTSGEARAQVAELAPDLGERGRDVASQFDVAADTFDSAWFDDGEVTDADDARFVAASRSVLDAILTGSTTRRSRDGVGTRASPRSAGR